MAPRRSDSLKTQARLIETAERLFAEVGINAVSLSEINREAGQRNKSSLHYHFGSRDGLLKAILSQHRDELNSQRLEMIAEVDDLAHLSTHEAVRIVVEPIANKLDSVSGNHYLRIVAQVIATPTNPLNDWLVDEVASAIVTLAPALARDIPYEQDVPLRRHRAFVINGMISHAMLLESVAVERGKSDPEWRRQFVEDTINCVCALIAAPGVPDHIPPP